MLATNSEGEIWHSRCLMANLLLGLAVCLLSILSARAATVPPGFAETTIPGPSAGNWDEAVGLAFEDNGRMYVWERSGRVWFKDPTDGSFTKLLDISEEVGDWGDYGCLGFALDPNFRANGYIYLLYTVDRHHLLFFGTPNYNPNSNQYNAATIGRVTRYTCLSSDGFRSVDPASRFILIGATKSTGFPMSSDTHGIGSLAFGEDGTLLASCGDGALATGADFGGPSFGSYAPQGLSDGILRPKEDIGAFRAQLVDCLNGKILRIDPATGNGVPGNPFYDPANPDSRASKVWALGCRNPFRMSVRPGSGSHNPADGNPGVIYIGNVGWNDWESLEVVTRPGQNLGWPMFDGLVVQADYFGVADTVDNLDAPNPLFPGAGCSQYFSFKDLLKDDTLNPAGQPPFVNPCSSSQRIPGSIPQFVRTRPVLDWSHVSATTRTPIYGPSGDAQIANVGAPGSPVSGTQFKGNCAIGGAWYTANAFPAQYQNSYFFADWGQGLIKNLTLDGNDQPLALTDFASNAGSIVSLAQHPSDGSLYYVGYNYNAAVVRRISYAGNRTPLAVASADSYYGVSPLTVQFSSTGSTDPDGQAITYSWNFGDGSPNSTAPNPSHVFSAPPGVAQKFVVTLTVTDSGGLSAQTSVLIGVNDTPPQVAITSPLDGESFSPTTAIIVNLNAEVSDAESPDNQLTYRWQTILHHNDHNHLVGVNTNHSGTSFLDPIGCDGINIYYYRIVLTVTDPTGLANTSEVRLYPDCGSPDTSPIISSLADQSIFEDSVAGPLSFTIGDAETAAANLQLSATSSNPSLLPVADIIFGGSGSNRTVTLMPEADATGSTTVTISVTDGQLTATDTLVVTVNPAVTFTKAFTNSTSITVPIQGASTPYPSLINVAGLRGIVQNATVTIRNVTHSWGGDLDILLVSPTGKKVVLMSDAGLGALNNVTVTLSDAAASPLPSSGLVSGTYRPANYAPVDTFAAPAPAGPYGGTLSVFNGDSANGTWSLYVFDDGQGDQGSIAGGWSLTLTTVADAAGTPTISSISDQFSTVNTAIPPIPFVVDDSDTPVDSLVLTAQSSNPGLLATNNIAFDGTGTNRTVTLSPVPDQIGAATITITVSDGTNSSGDSFVLTVNAINTPPTISSVSDQSIDEDTSTGAIPFVIGDAESAPGTLILSKGSSNTALVPSSNVVFGGSGSNRTVAVTPALNQTGTATITLTVSDGQYSTNTTFVVTVNPVNDPPTISAIPNTSVGVSASTGPLSFVIGDPETPAANLTLSGTSSNQELVPDSNIVFGGSGSNRTVTVTPVSGQTGTAFITLTVTDGLLSSSNSFVLTVSTLFVGTKAFTNSASITIPDSGAGVPYPSTINVTNMGGAISNITVTLRNISHTWSEDVDILLVGPGGQPVMLISDAGAGNPMNGVTVTLSDAAASSVPLSGAIVSTAYKPTDYQPGEILPAPAPVGPYGTALSVFNGQSPNGLWSLYAFDDGPGDQGNIAGGWFITITTGTGANAPPTISAIADQITTEDTPTSAIPFTISDPDTTLATLTLKRDSSNSVLIPTNNIVFGGSGSNRTVTITPAPNQSGTATITIGVSDGVANVSDTFLLTVTPSNDAPGITAIADQVIPEDTVLGPISFTIGDVESSAGSLVLSASSSDPVLIPTNSIVFGGVNSNRTVTITPAPNQSGSATIIVSVSDGVAIASDSFIVTVTPVNDVPGISQITDQAINEDSVLGPISFIVGDVETDASSLVVTATSSDTGLVPTNNIVLGGSSSNRTVTITPAANQSGSTTITLTVNDGVATTTSSFVLIVIPVNDAPSISQITDQTINEDTVLGPIPFTIGDVETYAKSLVVTATS